jgi:hypothetical protein
MPLLLALLFLLVFVAAAPAQNPPTFDLIIAGGRVIDPESGLDAVRHVGIKSGKIVMLSEAPLTGHQRWMQRDLSSPRASSTYIRTR